MIAHGNGCPTCYYDYVQHIIEAMRNTRHRHIPTVERTQKHRLQSQYGRIPPQYHPAIPAQKNAAVDSIRPQ